MMFALIGCAHTSWGDAGSPGALRYYYFIKSNYKELDHQDQTALESMVHASSLAPKSYYLKMETARLYARLGETEIALKYAKEAIALNDKAPEPLLFAAWISASAGHWDEAVNYYNEVLRRSPNNLDALTELAALYAETGKTDQAEATFKKRVAADSGYLSYYYLGSFYAKIGRLKEAISAFSTSVRKNPDFTRSLSELAALYEKTGDRKNAEKTYRSLIEARPEAIMPKARLASLLLQAGRAAEAKNLLKEIGGMPMDKIGPAQLLIGLIYYQQGLYEDAAAEFTELVKSSPDNAEARYHLARTLLEMDKIEAARDELKKIKKSSEFYVDAQLLLASTSGNDNPDKRLKEALDIINKAVRDKPESPRLRVAKAMLQEEMGELKQARKTIREAAKRFPRESEVHFRLGIIEDKLGDKEASVAAMREAIKQNPDHADALNYLAYTWAERRENLGEALVLAERADALKPDSGYILDTLGWIYFHMGHNKKALDFLERAVPLSGGDPVVLDHLGDVLDKLGRGREALNAYRQALESGFDNQEELNEKIKRLSK